MTPRVLFPRLPGPAAKARLEVIHTLPAGQLRNSASSSHRAAAPAPTGGTPITEAELDTVASKVRNRLGDWLASPLPRSRVSEADAKIGEALHNCMEISPSDAAHSDVWAFVTLILLPDVAVWRFSDRAEARLLGGPRNVFRRVWWRREVLGDLVGAHGLDGVKPLGEDELVGIFERSSMSRSRILARELARHILRSDASNRSEYTRDLLKRVRRVLAYRNVDTLSASEVQSWLEEISETDAPVGVA